MDSKLSDRRVGLSQSVDVNATPGRAVLVF